MSELAVMGAILLDDKFLPLAEKLIGPEDFSLVCVTKCFRAAQELRDDGLPIDEVSVYKRARVNPLTVSRFADHCPSLATADMHIRSTRKASAARRLVQETMSIAADTYAGQIGLNDAVERLNAIDREDKDHTRTVREMIKEVMLTLEMRTKHPGELLGFTTGYSRLDQITNGWQKGELTILAARPAMGKTALALNYIQHALRANKRCLLFSLEMSAESILQRMLAIGGTNMGNIKTGAFNDGDWARMSRQTQLLADGNLSIEDGGNLTLDKLIAKVRSSHYVTPIDFLVIDYLQLMSSVRTAKDNNREREVAEISRGLKNLARELKIPILALAQLNRGVEARANKRPGLADLRESGAIEQDADVVTFLYRDEVYDPESKDKGFAEVLISKNRNGEIGIVRLTFLGQFQRFEEARGNP